MACSFRKETANALKASAAYFLIMMLSVICVQAKDVNIETDPRIARIRHMIRLVSSVYFRFRRKHYRMKGKMADVASSSKI